MKHKMYLKVISIILIFALILQSIPIVISAETVSKKTEEIEAEEAYVIGEETRLREHRGNTGTQGTEHRGRFSVLTK